MRERPLEADVLAGSPEEARQTGTTPLARVDGSLDGEARPTASKPWRGVLRGTRPRTSRRAHQGPEPLIRTCHCVLMNVLI